MAIAKGCVRHLLGVWICRVCLATLLLPSAGLAEERFYRWTDAQGRVHFSDQPPAQGQVRQITLDSHPSAAVPAGSVAGKTRPAGRADPSERGHVQHRLVGGFCKQARNYFRAEGIPFSERDIEKSARARREYERLQGRGVPVILVGKARMNGFSPDRFRQLIKPAGVR